MIFCGYFAKNTAKYIGDYISSIFFNNLAVSFWQIKEKHPEANWQKELNYVKFCYFKKSYYFHALSVTILFVFLLFIKVEFCNVL